MRLFYCYVGRFAKTNCLRLLLHCLFDSFTYIYMFVNCFAGYWFAVMQCSCIEYGSPLNVTVIYCRHEICGTFSIPDVQHCIQPIVQRYVYQMFSIVSNQLSNVRSIKYSRGKSLDTSSKLVFCLLGICWTRMAWRICSILTHKLSESVIIDSS